MSPLSSSPENIAIIMDGNGRWANSRGRERVFGHIKGARVAKRIVTHAAQNNIKSLTLYAFSEENWSRPVEEVSFLMRLLSRYIIRERQSLSKNNIRFRCIGQIDKIPEAIRNEVEETMSATKDNTGMVLTFALSYGGRQEIIQAVKNIADLANNNKLKPADINEELISSMMQTAPVPDPDLMIRTSGEMRTSNFLPWQMVYTEFYFTDVLWPDFTAKHFDQALHSYSNRERRFGKVNATIDSNQLQN